jgi:hypothetical protein
MSAVNHQIYESDIYRFLMEMQIQNNEIRTIDLSLITPKKPQNQNLFHVFI